MLPKCLLSITGRSCYQIPLVQQDITKKTTCSLRFGPCNILVHKLPYCSISHVLFVNCSFQDMARTGNTYETWLRGDNTVNIQGRIMVLWFCPSPHWHLSIYMYTKFNLNVNSSFKVICRTRYLMDGRTDRQSGDYMLAPLGSIQV